MTNAPIPPKERDVQFLTEEFGIPAFKAARLVTGSSDVAEDLLDAELRRQHEVDPLAGVPTPEPPKNEYIADADEDQLKPIVGEHNLRGGG